jgi:hypothetical protein
MNLQQIFSKVNPMIEQAELEALQDKSELACDYYNKAVELLYEAMDNERKRRSRSKTKIQQCF